VPPPEEPPAVSPPEVPPAVPPPAEPPAEVPPAVPPPEVPPAPPPSLAVATMQVPALQTCDAGQGGSSGPQRSPIGSGQPKAPSPTSVTTRRERMTPP
jgi:hypothetical protein